ncbi:MAG: histidine--tRNA ligase [Acidimicrobiales bacterium]|jgi:histidyl-tRNA synthetase|nr:histidine--tRNA ligase [Acidimicrobiales bacterium]
MSKSLFQAPRGTRDILPEEAGKWRSVLDAFADLAEGYGYGQVISPIFEDVGVFQRLGENTEIVSKEMFIFHDKDLKSPQELALRPELTASICRAYAQHRPVTPWKVWYSGPQFRYEKPQAGRFRQFVQVGAEVIGEEDPATDVEVISLAWRFYESIGLKDVALLLNTLGDPATRTAFNHELKSYLSSRINELSPQSQITMEKNPLRVLDSKRENDLEVLGDAPTIEEFLNQADKEHFDSVRDGLNSLNIPFEITPRLVRGLDYYTRTTFEFISTGLQTAQNAIGGGGRYDGLIEEMGGPPTQGIGFALGVDRILLACEAEKLEIEGTKPLEVFVVDMTGGSHATQIADELRKSGFGVDRSFGGRSMKAQMKVADRSGALYAIIVGDDELEKNEVTLRDLRGDGSQVRVSRSSIEKALNETIEGRNPQ